MKKFYRYGLSAALFCSALSVQAQQRPSGPSFALGTSQALAQQLNNQASAGAARGSVPTVSLRVSGSQAFTGRVNYRQELAADGAVVIGELQGVPNSSFLVRIEGAQVEGHIVLRDTKQAYRYAADAQGQVSVQEVDIDKVVCTDYNTPPGYQNPAPAPERAAGRTAAVASLQSYPGARACIMLDLDGQYVSGTPWNNGNPINAAPAAIANDPAKVQAFWELVSEDFRPFNLNVTTDEAVFNSYPKTMRMRCIITPTNTAAPGAGGVAYISSFKWNDDTPCWVFMSDPKSGGEAASHEVGHTLGLGHDGRNNPAEGYYTGQDNSGPWAPIMGAGYYKAVTHWSKGEYNRANNLQDDLAIISSATYNFGYRTDDHGNSTAAATPLSRNSTALSGAGIIERTADQDFFSFTAGAGTVNLNVNTVSRYGNLDIVARLYNSTGGLIGTYNPTGLNAPISLAVSAGTYYLSVDGTGTGNPATDGYSDYASLGNFTISGTAPVGGSTPPPPPPPPLPNNVVTAFKDCSFGGYAVSLAVGDYTLAQLQSRGVVNNDLSSVKVSSGYEMQLFADDNFAGTSVTITADNSCLVANGFNDVASSLKVRPLSVATAYKDCSYGGYAIKLSVGEYTLAALQARGILNNDLSSLKVNSGYEVQLFADDNFAGTSVTVTADNSCLVANGFNDVASSLKVRYATGAGSVAQVAVSAASLEAPLAGLVVYPNPVSDRLTLASASNLVGGQLRILGATGQLVWKGTYTGEAVDVSGFKPGLYTLVVSTTDRQKLISRFSKQ